MKPPCRLLYFFPSFSSGFLHLVVSPHILGFLATGSPAGHFHQSPESICCKCALRGCKKPSPTQHLWDLLLCSSFSAFQLSPSVTGAQQLPCSYLATFPTLIPPCPFQPQGPWDTFPSPCLWPPANPSSLRPPC